MFFKENQLATVVLSLARAKIWEECHYDRILNHSSTLIPAQGTKFPNMSMAANSFQGLMLSTANSKVAMQPVFNPVLLQTLPPLVTIIYPPYNPYQPRIVSFQEFPIASVPKESNESLSLNLTKKMEELAINIAKEKEKRPK